MLVLQASKGHKRTGSAPPSIPIGSLRQKKLGDLQGIPEDADDRSLGASPSSPQKVHFTDEKVASNESLLMAGLDALHGSVAPAPLQDDTAVEDSQPSESVAEPSRTSISAFCAQPVSPLTFPAAGDDIPTSAVKPVRMDVSQSPHSDAVAFPPTPERRQHAAQDTLSGPETYSGPVACAFPS